MGAQSCSRTETKKAANTYDSTMMLLLLLLSLSSCLPDATHRVTNDGRISSDAYFSLESLAEAFQAGEAGDEVQAVWVEGGEVGEREGHQLKLRSFRKKSRTKPGPRPRPRPRPRPSG